MISSRHNPTTGSITCSINSLRLGGNVSFPSELQDYFLEVALQYRNEGVVAEYRYVHGQHPEEKCLLGRICEKELGLDFANNSLTLSLRFLQKGGMSIDDQWKLLTFATSKQDFIPLMIMLVSRMENTKYFTEDSLTYLSSIASHCHMPKIAEFFEMELKPVWRSQIDILKMVASLTIEPGNNELFDIDDASDEEPSLERNINPFANDNLVMTGEITTTYSLDEIFDYLNKNIPELVKMKFPGGEMNLKKATIENLERYYDASLEFIDSTIRSSFDQKARSLANNNRLNDQVILQKLNLMMNDKNISDTNKWAHVLCTYIQMKMGCKNSNFPVPPQVEEVEEKPIDNKRKRQY